MLRFRIFSRFGFHPFLLFDVRLILTLYWARTRQVRMLAITPRIHTPVRLYPWKSYHYDIIKITITINITITIAIIITMIISPRCRDCRCWDRGTHCRNQSSFHSCSVEEALNKTQRISVQFVPFQDQDRRQCFVNRFFLKTSKDSVMLFLDAHINQ